MEGWTHVRCRALAPAFLGAIWPAHRVLSELVLVPAPIEEHGSLLTIIKVSNQLVVRWVALSGDLGQLVRSLWKGVEWPVAADDSNPISELLRTCS